MRRGGTGPIYSGILEYTEDEERLGPYTVVYWNIL